MSKWMKVDPATLKVGDEVRWIVEITGGRVIREVAVREIAPDGIRLGLTYIAPGNGTWYIRKPTEKAKPPTRPDEPPVGSFFRVERTGVEYVRVEKYGLRQYFLVAGLGHWAWDEITIPGDTITRLLLVEATDD